MAKALAICIEPDPRTAHDRVSKPWYLWLVGLDRSRAERKRPRGGSGGKNERARCRGGRTG
eukprot:13738320-Alexandrium_andersonii.AAC.1